MAMLGDLDNLAGVRKAFSFTVSSIRLKATHDVKVELELFCFTCNERTVRPHLWDNGVASGTSGVLCSQVWDMDQRENKEKKYQLFVHVSIFPCLVGGMLSSHF